VQLTRGYLQVYTGNGKGKTTAALGLALRATVHGLRVAFIQFMKNDNERPCAERIGVAAYRSFGKDHRMAGWYHPRKVDEPAPAEVVTGWDWARELITAGRHDIVILDEINVALAFQFLAVQDVLPVLQQRPAHVEIICTGRAAPPELVAVADLVSEIGEVKHMYHTGVAARRGIDF
jgi:cob(I)alamin adenosyltransferase